MSRFRPTFRDYFLQPRIMGILNVTPDSFSDGGKYIDPHLALRRVKEMIEEGADIIDIGGESSRPGAVPVSEEEELQRVLPVVRQIREQYDVPLSIDTYKPRVARACLEAGVDMVNDITGLRGVEMRKVAAEYNCPVVVMHMQGKPQVMQVQPMYTNCVQEIHDFFTYQVELCRRDGILNIILDPGIGFGKSLDHNLQILREFQRFQSFGLPLMIGCSRKSFLGALLGAKVEDRLPGSLSAHLIALMHGATIIRVHDIKPHHDMVTLYRAVHEHNM